MSFDTLKTAVQALGQEMGVGLDLAYLLYIMGLEIGTDDYEGLLRDHVLDGKGNDRKVDFFYLDTAGPASDRSSSLQSARLGSGERSTRDQGS